MAWEIKLEISQRPDEPEKGEVDRGDEGAQYGEAAVVDHANSR